MTQELELNEAHTTEALALLPQQFSGADNLKAFLTAFLSRVQEAENMLIELWQNRWLDNATGDLLDELGSIVGQERNGLGDDDYRIMIRVRVRINLSSGLDSDIVETFGMVLQDPSPSMALEEYYPASIVVRLLDEVAGGNDVVTILASILGEVRSASVLAQLVYLNAAPEASFSFADLPDTSESDAAMGFADDAQTTGGDLADVIEA